MPPVRAMFVLSAARGAPLVAGGRTHADAVLRAAGAVNVMQGFDGYRPLSAEAAAQLAPEAVVMMAQAVAEAGGLAALLGIPALAVTPVARNRRVPAVDGSYLLGFGPRATPAPLPRPSSEPASGISRTGPMPRFRAGSVSACRSRARWRNSMARPDGRGVQGHTPWPREAPA